MFVNALLQKLSAEEFALCVEKYQGKLLDAHKKQKMLSQKAFIRSLWHALDSFKKDITKPKERGRKRKRNLIQKSPTCKNIMTGSERRLNTAPYGKRY